MFNVVKGWIFAVVLVILVIVSDIILEFIKNNPQAAIMSTISIILAAYIIRTIVRK